MKYVYILRSIKNFNKTYVGITSDLRRRLREHNEGKSYFTSNFKPWKVETYLAFSDAKKAKQFEKYLKHGTGKAFIKKFL